MDQSLYYIIDATRLRIIIIESLDEAAAEKIRNLRPIADNIAIVGNSKSNTELFGKVSGVTHKCISCFPFVFRH